MANRRACMRRARASAARGVCRVVILNNNIIKSFIVLSDLLALQFHGVQLLRIVMTSRVGAARTAAPLREPQPQQAWLGAG